VDDSVVVLGVSEALDASEASEALDASEEWKKGGKDERRMSSVIGPRNPESWCSG
jgi:hypothetical protein